MDSKGRRMIAYIEKHGGRNGLSWKGIAEKFGMKSNNAARRRWQRYEKSRLRLTKQTLDGHGNVRFETYKTVPKETKPTLLDGEVEGYTTNPYGGEWVRYAKKKTKVNPEVLQELIDGLDFTRVPKLPVRATNTERHVIIVITDVHIGMSCDGSIYDLHWNLEELYRRLDLVIKNCPESTDVTLCMLGDYTDGMNQQTARGGHKLQQNLNDKEMFKHGVEAMLYLLDGLTAKSKGKITVEWLSNSNHPGVMDYIIGSTLKLCGVRRYSNVEIKVSEEFLTVVTGNALDNLILTHGYDERFMKRGLPRFLSKDHISRLNNAFNIMQLGGNVTLLRGDQHQFSDIRYDMFRDIMCPAFSNPSGWVTTNFMTNYKGGFLFLEPTPDEESPFRLQLFEF